MIVESFKKYVCEAPVVMPNSSQHSADESCQSHCSVRFCQATRQNFQAKQPHQCPKGATLQSLHRPGFRAPPSPLLHPCHNRTQCQLESDSQSEWRRKWQPPPVFLPRKFHGQRSLVGDSPWGRKGSDTSARLSTLGQMGFPGGSMVESACQSRSYRRPQV